MTRLTTGTAPRTGSSTWRACSLRASSSRQGLATSADDARNRPSAEQPANYRLLFSDMRYDTIPDAIITCTRKPTRVSLIYRRETTKPCKTEKLKRKKTDMLRSNSKTLGNHVVSPEEVKERLQWEWLAETEGLKSGIKERVCDGKLIIIS